jgi:hypothetical protein
MVLLLACVLWIPRWLYPSLTEADLRGVSDAAKVQERESARLKLQNDARTTLLQGFGALLLLTGAGIGAAVTLRQIRVSQGQLQVTREQMEHTLKATRQQLTLTEQGQITDRYTRAVEQLGHEKAPVRLGALYSLEHLAQDNPDYRQTVVDVVCAYLRMPFTPPGRAELNSEPLNELAPVNSPDGAPYPATGRDPTQEELQVRQTAQHLLANHLRPLSRQQAFWPGISLDLTGATLVDFNFAQVSVKRARFVRATFEGDAWFGETTFHDDAWFGETTFQGRVQFTKAAFEGYAGFGGATFQGDAGFEKANFQGPPGFSKAIFRGDVWFDETTFRDDVWFEETIFRGRARFTKVAFARYAGFAKALFKLGAWFREATFQGYAGFDQATFEGHAGFGEANFEGDAGFGGATFMVEARFARATFEGDARFGKAIFFKGAAGFSGAHVLHLDDRDRHRVWPRGWTVLPNPTDPSRGTLVRVEQAEETEPALPPSESTD